MNRISAHALLGTTFSTPDGDIKTHVVLPFFTRGLEVRFLLVVLPDDRLFVVRDPPFEATRRVVRYAIMPTNQALADTRPRDIALLLHYDPWWLLRGREDVPAAVRDAAISTNIANTRVEGRHVSSVHFDVSLSSVVGIRVSRRLLGSRWIPREDLFQHFE